MSIKITPDHRDRQAYVYVRQSTTDQLLHNHESRRRQYALTDRARALGWSEVVIVDDDLGRSGGGVERPGFERLLLAICEARVGIVLAVEASRLARNGRDWHTLLEFCGLVGCLLADEDGVYDPRLPNDRLLLGMKGTMSEMELSLLRQRSLEALRQKARRGELFFTVAVGYRKARHDRIEIDPDLRVREAITLVFRKFCEFRSVRQIHLWLRQEEIRLPAVEHGPLGLRIIWKLPVYNTILHLLTNPIYAGAYAFGRTCSRVSVHEGRKRVGRGYRRAQSEWGGVAPRSPRGVHLVGGIREEPAPDCRHCQQQGANGARLGASRRCVIGRSVALRSLRAPAPRFVQRHGRVLRALSLPRRASQPRNGALHRVRRAAGRRGRIGGTAAGACTLGDRGRLARDRCPCGRQFRGPSASRTRPHPGALRGGAG